MDKYYGNVCELDIIFNFQKAYFILDELLLAGEMQESSKKNVLRVIGQQDGLEDMEVCARCISSCTDTSPLPDLYVSVSVTPHTDSYTHCRSKATKSRRLARHTHHNLLLPRYDLPCLVTNQTLPSRTRNKSRNTSSKLACSEIHGCLVRRTDGRACYHRKASLHADGVEARLAHKGVLGVRKDTHGCCFRSQDVC